MLWTWAISVRFWQLAAIAALAIHVFLAVHWMEPAIFQRCGALWVIVGGAVVARPVIRKGYLQWDEGTLPKAMRPVESTSDELDEKQQQRLDARSVQLWGPLIAVTGTLIWGYGDLAASALLGRF